MKELKKYNIGLKNGIIDPKHRKNIGVALWEFIWCINRQTKEIVNAGEKWGKVFGGRPINAEEIAADLGLHPQTVRNNLKRLEKHNYIKIIRNQHGLKIYVANPKKWFAEAETIEVKTTTENDQKTATTTKQVFELYNQICTKLPKARELTEKRKEKIKVRLKEHSELDFWRCVFEKANDTPFLYGDNKNGWTARLDWFIENDTNAIKVLEGHYDKKRHAGLKAFAEKMAKEINDEKARS